MDVVGLVDLLNDAAGDKTIYGELDAAARAALDGYARPCCDFTSSVWSGRGLLRRTCHPTRSGCTPRSPAGLQPDFRPEAPPGQRRSRIRSASPRRRAVVCAVHDRRSGSHRTKTRMPTRPAWTGRLRRSTRRRSNTRAPSCPDDARARARRRTRHLDPAGGSPGVMLSSADTAATSNSPTRPTSWGGRHALWRRARTGIRRRPERSTRWTLLRRRTADPRGCRLRERARRRAPGDDRARRRERCTAGLIAAAVQTAGDGITRLQDIRGSHDPRTRTAALPPTPEETKQP